MKTVYKYPVDLNADDHTVVISDGAQFIHVDRDPAYPAGKGHIALWARVNPDNPPIIPVPLIIIGTGHPLPDATGPHLGSVVDGPFVWHVFHTR